MIHKSILYKILIGNITMLFKQYFVKQLVFSVFYRTVWQTARYEEAIKTCPPLCPREI